MSREFTALTEAEVSAGLKDFPRWAIVDQQITIDLKFDSFTDAFVWLSKVVLIAEKIKHHPNIVWNYNKVKLSLSTHDINGLSTADLDLVRALDPILP